MGEFVKEKDENGLYYDAENPYELTFDEIAKALDLKDSEIKKYKNKVKEMQDIDELGVLRILVLKFVKGKTEVIGTPQKVKYEI